MNIIKQPLSLFTCNLTVHRKGGLCGLVCRIYINKNGGTGGGGWVHPQNAMYTWQLIYKAMVGTGWTNSCLGCTEGLRKCYSYLVEGLNSNEKGGLSSERLFCWATMLTIAS